MMQHKGLCKLMGLDYKIEYKKGVENKVADALSRQQGQSWKLETDLSAVTELVPKWLDEIKESYENDSWIMKLQDKYDQEGEQGKFTKHQGVWKYKGRLCIGNSKNWREKIIREVHDSSVGGHSGILDTYKRVKSIFFWPKMKEDIHNYVQSCDNCQQNKHENVKLPGLLQPLPVPEEAWESLSMDFITGLPKSEGKEVIFVVVDRLTKYAHFMSLKHPYKASDVAQAFLDTVYRLHGLPRDIVSDRDPVFTSKFWQEIMDKLGIKLNMGTSYHPQTDGQTERVNQCIETYLRCMLFNQPKNWNKWLPLAEFWYNTNYHASLKTSPFQALYGYAPPQLPLGSPPKYKIEGVNEMMKERHNWIKGLKEQLRRAQDRMKRFADERRTERKFEVGDWVYLKLQPYRQVTVQKRSNQKLAAKFYGPFEIIARIGSVAYELKLPEGSQIHPVFHVSQLKKKVGSEQVVTPDIPINYPQSLGHEYPEGILGRRILKRKNEAIPQILVKWEKQDDENASWEDYEVIKKKFPQFILKDKDDFERGRMSGDNTVELGAVEAVDQVKPPEKKRKAIGHNGQLDGVNEKSLNEGTQCAGSLINKTGLVKGVSMNNGPQERDVSELNVVNRRE